MKIEDDSTKSAKQGAYNKKANLINVTKFDCCKKRLVEVNVFYSQHATVYANHKS